MIQAIDFFIHTWVKGHSVEANRFLTALEQAAGIKRTYRCECGKLWVKR